MALTHLAFTLLILASTKCYSANHTESHGKTALDPKRRNNIVDEAFLEQKDVLLDMLESKLKEVKDKKRNKSERQVNNFKLETHNQIVDEHKHNKCANSLQNVDVKVKINGISAVGDADVKLKYGNSGNGIVKVNANGISNIGQANMEMGVGNSAVYIPGLSNLFIDHDTMNCDNNLHMVGKVQHQQTADETRKAGENETNNENNNKTAGSNNSIKIEPSVLQAIATNASVSVNPSNQSPLMIDQNHLMINQSPLMINQSPAINQGPLIDALSTPANINTIANPIVGIGQPFTNGVVNV